MAFKKNIPLGLIAFTAVLLLWFTAQWLQEPGEAQLEVVKAATELDELKENLIIANKILDSHDLIAPYGHVSARIPNTDRILITDRKPPGMVTLDDILVVNLEGDVVEGEGQTYSEIYMHTGVYKARKDVNAVAHTHSEYARALGMVGISFQPTSNEGAAYINKAKIYPRIGLINTQELGADVAELLGMDNAALLRAHGAVIVGPTLEETTMRAVFLEKAARVHLLAASVGKPTPFTAEESARIQEEMGGSLVEDVENQRAGRPWLYYSNKVSQGSPK